MKIIIIKFYYIFRRIMMKTLYKSTLLLITPLCMNILLVCHSAAAQCPQQQADEYWAGSTPQSLVVWGSTNYGSNFQTDTVGLSGSAAIRALLRPDLVPPNNPASLIITTNIGQLIAEMSPGDPSIGQAIVDLEALINNPVPANVLSQDLLTAIHVINPASGDLSTATNSVFTLINIPGLPGAPVSSGNIIGDLGHIRNTIRVGSANVAAALTYVLQTSINVPALPGAPVSTGSVVGDDGLIINALSGGSASLAATVTNLIGLLDVTAIPIAGNPPIVSTNRVDDDIKLAIDAINPVYPSMGLALNNVLNRLSLLAQATIGGPFIKYQTIGAALTAAGY
jgi:hypothetical protein